MRQVGVGDDSSRAMQPHRTWACSGSIWRRMAVWWMSTTDRDSMFTVAPRAGESKEQQREADRLTQLGRALRELGIGSILAYSPQAKGRIERSFRTAQDRLVKHLRLAKISTMEAANEFLEKEYWPEWNEHFASPVADFPNHHRPLTPQLNLEAILSHVEERVIGNDYTFSFAGRRYQIQRA